MDPTSPPQVDHLEPGLQRTSQGSTPTSDYIGTTGMYASESIRSQIARHIWNVEECPVDNMLRDLLADCTVERPESFDDTGKTWLFTDCLEKVIHICNGGAQAKTTRTKSSEIMKALTEYTRARGERRDLFVTATNAALLSLRGLQVNGVRPPRDDALVCFAVHPSSPSQNEPLEYTEPDVVIVSESDTRGAHGSQQHHDDTLIRIDAKVLARKPLTWRHVRTFVEFARFQEYESESDVLPAGPVLPGGNPRRPDPELVQPESSSKYRKSAHGHSATIQAGCYAAEMFAAHAGRLHVFGIIIIDDALYLWRYDRQGAIRCSGFNFIHDLPRFLVLLFVMQRFEPQDWGLNPHVDPQFGPLPASHKTVLCSNDNRVITADLQLADEDRVTRIGLDCRATDVFAVECNDLSEEDLVVKFYWADIGRRNEPEILKKVYKIAKTHPDVKGHVPTMLWHKTFKSSSTGKIREYLGLKTEGARVLCMIIFRKLRPITELDGDTFLSAWWATVKCHLALWKNGVYHRDISPSNLMYHKDKQRIVAVLNDFDMALIKEIPTEAKHVGAFPFMAYVLLTDRGQIKHSYEHDAESFIWVLVWVALRYENGRLKGNRDRPLDEWLIADAVQCRMEKSGFLMSCVIQRILPFKAGAGYEQSSELGRNCILALMKNILETPGRNPTRVQDVHGVFEKLLGVPTGLCVEKS